MYVVPVKSALFLRSDTIAQCLNPEHEIHHPASKLCILGLDLLK
jgi:hypothetical protein